MRKVIHKATMLALLAGAATGFSTYAQTALYPGFARADVFTGLGGVALATMTNDTRYPNNPNSVSYVKFLEFPAGQDDGTPPPGDVFNDYGVRITGVIIPKQSGNYVFYLAADDNANFWLSTDANPANKRLLAWEPEWNAVRDFTGEARRPNCANGDCENISAPVALVANQQYWFEALMKEGGGGDNLAVAWAREGEALAETTLPNGNTTILPIGSEFLAVIASANVAITQQPKNANGALGGSASFTVGINDVPTATFQWKKNGGDIPGATSRTYNTPAITQADHGSRYSVEVRGPNNTVTSSEVTLSVIPVQEVAGVALAEVYRNIGGTAVGNLTNNAKYPGSPDDRVTVKFLEYPPGADDGTPPPGDVFNDYGVRISGLIIPKETASYVFYLAADDGANFLLSTDSSPANKRLLAWEPQWNPVRDFLGENRRPECANGDCENVSVPVSLVANQRYYFEAHMKEGGGGDNLAVTWAKEGELPEEVVLPNGNTTILPIKGEFLAYNVPQLIELGGIRPQIKTFSFTVRNVGQSQVDPASVRVVLDGQQVTPTTSTAGDVITYTYTHPTPLAQGSAHTYSIVVRDTGGRTVEAEASYTIPVQWLPTANLNAPAVVDDAWAIRFIFDTGTVSGIPASLARINRVGTPDFLATYPNGTVIDLTRQTHNFGGGFIPDDEGYPGDVLAAGNWTGEDFIVLSVGHIVIPTDGDYTFGIHSDDGMALRIRCGTVVRVSGGGTVDPVDPETAVHPADTGDSNTRAVYNLKAGTYRIEFFWWERGGGDHGEIYAAKGNFANDGDTDTWALVGDTAAGGLRLTSAAVTPCAAEPPPRATASISRTGNSVTISSSAGGTVQRASSLTNPNWTNVGPAPQTVTADGAAGFFRILQ